MRGRMTELSASDKIIGRADAPTAIYIGEPDGPTATVIAVPDSYPIAEILILLLLILTVIFLVRWIRKRKKK